MVTKQDIFNMLTALGIQKTDTVLVHSSMRSTGGVEGGCDTVIDAFTEYLSDGLFIVPTHTWNSVKPSQPLYDVRTSMPCTGALTTVAVGRKEGVRSLHPTHSVVAFGKRAREFVQGEEHCGTPTPPGGCWARLYDEDAKILLLGVEHNRNTYIHAIDEQIDLPNRLCETPFTAQIRDENGQIHTVEFRGHCPGVGSAYFTNYKKPLEVLGAVTYATLGNALVYCCNARKCTEIIKHLWQKTDHDLVAQEEEIPFEYYADLM